MQIIIGSARSDERKQYSGGKAGDQRQSSAPDYSGEVSMQKFYVHSKGWNIIRAKSASIANRIASAMKIACNNPNIGYSQSDRYGVVKYGVGTKQKCNADCSSLVRQCIKEASDIDPGDFTTANAVTKLNTTGLFQATIPYTSSTILYKGDILCTKSKGHIVVVTGGNVRQELNDNNNIKQFKISQDGIDLIKKFEGCVLKVYLDAVGKPTCGYGHTAGLTKAMVGQPITQGQADEFLRSDLAKFEKSVNATGLQLNQNQFDALVSFTYNLGAGNLKKLITNRNLSQIADAMLLYNKAGGKVLNGLVKRRQAERNLFMKES